MYLIKLRVNQKMNFRIRNYCNKDLKKLYEICIKTGDAGQDASRLYRNHKLLGHVYVGPYIKLEPSSAFILDYESELCGYIIGTLDSKLFYKKVESEWLPCLKQKYKIPKKKLKYYNLDDKIIHSFHFPGKIIDYPDYPAHLHIDILPRAQKKGIGLKMMNHFIKYLGKQNVKGLHLGVDIKNDSAIRFYKKYGLITLEEKIDSLVLGIRI